MNRVSKGTRIEREFENILKSHGFITHRAIRTRFNRIDIFDRFDICAKYNKFQLSNTLWIQISTRWKSGKIKQFLEEFPGGIDDYILMVRKKDRKEFEIMRFINNIYCNKEWIKITLEQIISQLNNRVVEYYE